MMTRRVSTHGKASHPSPKFYFKFKPIGVNHGLNHEGTGNKVGQANAKMEKSSQRIERRKVNPPYEEAE